MSNVAMKEVDAVREIPAEEVDDLFEMETLSPVGEADGMRCVVILCIVIMHDENERTV